jgi:hypothetical protein
VSQRIDSLHVPSPSKERQSVFSKKIVALATGLAAVVLLFAAVAIVVPVSHTAVKTASIASLRATNPELMVADRYLREAAKRSESAFLSANPELMAARRYAGAFAEKSEDSFLAANPELISVQRQPAAEALHSDSGESATLAANPELIVFHQYVFLGAAE